MLAVPLGQGIWALIHSCDLEQTWGLPLSKSMVLPASAMDSPSTADRLFGQSVLLLLVCSGELINWLLG